VNQLPTNNASIIIVLTTARTTLRRASRG